MEAAVDLSPKNFAALKNLAVLYQRAGFKHKAIEIWERALGSAQDDDAKHDPSPGNRTRRVAVTR